MPDHVKDEQEKHRVTSAIATDAVHCEYSII